MLYILFSTIILLPVFAGFGRIFNKIFGDFFQEISGKLFTGLFSIALIFTITVFFFPLDIYIELGTISIGLAAFFYFKIYKEFWNLFSKTKFSFFVISFFTLFFGSYYPFILDHFGYYVPTIKWIAEVGLVQGISNLDLILGQMSIWHILQAGFSNFTDPFLRLNVVVLIIYLIYIFEKKSWIHLFFLPILFLFSQSPSPDLPVMVFSLIVLNEVFSSNKKAEKLLAFSIFIFAIKPTMIWVPILVFLYSLLILNTKLKFVFPGILVLILFLFKNIWTFGFPVFPVQFLDFNFSWKPNSELLKNSSEMAILKTYDMQFSFSEISKFSTFDYIKNWLFLDGMKGRIHQFFILSLVIFFLFSLKKNSIFIWLIFISILIKSTLVIMFSAQYRFFIDVFFVIFFVLFYQKFSKQFSLMIFSVLTIFFGIFLSFPNLTQAYLPSFKLGNFMKGINKNQWYKPSGFELKKYKTQQIGNLKFNVVENYPFSFDTPIPAISPGFIKEDLNTGIFPQLKGKTIKEGFIWRKITEEEKSKIKIILEDFK
jgi:hypothetical protein